jgi:hypothetical protein
VPTCWPNTLAEITKKASQTTFFIGPLNQE